jgi:hypothetical protein
MNAADRPLPTWLKWLCGVGGLILILAALWEVYRVVMPLIETVHAFRGPDGHKTPEKQWLTIFGVYAGKLAGLLVALWLGLWLVRKAMAKNQGVVENAGEPLPIPAAVETAPLLVPATPVRTKRWSSYNVLHLAADAKRLWQFDAKGNGLVLGREHRVPHTQPVPAKLGAKNWTSLWQPKLNIAWLPPENIFFRVVELPASSMEETVSMVELQMEKLSPLPVAQMVWTMHVLGTRTAEAKGDAPPENLQTVVVVIVARAAVEAFLGRLEQEGFQADQLEAPMLDQLEVISPKEDGTWIFPLTIGGQHAALVAWWSGGALRNLSFVVLPATGDRAAELKNQLTLLVMAGEIEGWLTAQPKWHVVADAANAGEWEHLLRTALDEPAKITAPPSPAELAARTAKRASAGSPAYLLPAEFTARYRQRFIDRLWLRGLASAGALYAVFLVVYFCAVAWLGYRTHGVEVQVAQISNDYTNAIQLKARYSVLKEREQLKYAALDSWQAVAQALPEGLSIQRFSFANGKRLLLSGTCEATQIGLVTEKDQFYDGMRNAQLNGQPVFDQNPDTGEQLVYRISGDKANWNFGLDLLHSEGDSQ